MKRTVFASGKRMVIISGKMNYNYVTILDENNVQIGYNPLPVPDNKFVKDTIHQVWRKGKGVIQGKVIWPLPVDYILSMDSTVRDNLLHEEGYRPYCGNVISRTDVGGCHNPRANFNGKQFVCPSCGWTSKFKERFINRYIQKWNLPVKK